MVDPLTAGLLIQGGAGVLGELLSMDDKAEQQRLIRQAMDEFGNIDLPKLEEIAAEQLGPSEMGSLRADPEMVAAQRASLEELKRLSQSGGLRLEDRAMQNEALGRASRAESAGRQRISEDMAMRGQSGSGAALAMQLQNQQGAAQRGSESAMQAAAQGQRRALDAMLQRGRLAGDMRGQEFSEKARAAEARDSISRWNATARADANRYNAGLAQQGFNNSMSLAGARANTAVGAANHAGQNAQDTRQLAAGVGKAGYDAASGYDDRERKKKQQGGY